MKKLALILPLVLFLGCEMPQDKNKKEIEQIKQQITELSDKLDTMSQQIQPQKDITPKIAQLKNQLQQTKEKLAKNSAKIDELTAKINELSQKIDNMKDDNLGYIVIKPTTLITIKKTNVYSAPDENSTIVDTFDKKTTFTSYKEQNGFIKVTGYFVHRKWVENKKEWWVKKEDCKVKVLGE